MTFSMPRAGNLLLAVLLMVAGASAGELYRPVPSDAQVTRFTRFNIRYALRDVVANGVQKVEFYITEDMGRTWRLYGEDPDRTSPMTIEVPGEGVYGFVCIATDRFGNREREPGPRTRPETVIVVDRTPPDAKWLSPRQDVLGRSGAVELSWEATDANFSPAPVKIQYAMDARGNHDRDAVWTTLQEELSAKGSINWTPPAASSGKYNFRLIAEDRAGNLAVAYNPATIIFDSTPPTILDVSPLRSNKLENNIVVNADDGAGGSGVKEISLYTSDNSGGTWTLVKETTETGESVPVKRGPGQPIAFAAERAGSFGLWPVVFDEAGNATPLPSIGVVGPFVLVIDNEPPTVTLSNSFLQGMAAVLANDTRRVEWNAYDPHILNNSAVISLSLDNGNTWQELRSAMPATGSELIQFPFGSQSEEAKIRVAVSDEFGNVGEAVSDTFKLARAGTTITDVTPVGGSFFDGGSSSVGGALPPWGGDDFGTPPTIPPAPGSPDVGLPVTYPTGGSGTSPFPLGGSSDFPATTYVPPVSTDPYESLYGDGQSSAVSPIAPITSSSFGGESLNESTALSLPTAMFEQPLATPPADGGLSLPPMTSTPPVAETPPAVPATPPAPAWTPSPSAGQAADAVVPGPSSGGWNLEGLAPPSPDASSSPAPSAPGAGDVWAPPPAPENWDQPPASQGATSAPAPISDWPSGGDFAPPAPLGDPDGQLSMPPLDSGSGLELPADWSQPLQLPSLGGTSQTAPPPAAPQTPAAVSPPAVVPPPAIVPQPPPEQPQQVQAQAPVAPVQPTDNLAPIPPVREFENELTRPPSLQSAPSRPTDPRGLSNYYAEESTAYLNEGRLDLALESGKKAYEADSQNARALMALSQVYAQDIEGINNFATAANLAKDATGLSRNWETWWNCADVFYRWSHKRNSEIQALLRQGIEPPLDMLDERNQSLNNARIAINNSATLVQHSQATEAEQKKVANSQGLISYLAARTIPEPVNPGEAAGPASMAQYRNDMSAYRAAVTPALQEALPFFQTAMRLDGSPAYSEAFHLGIINFRLGGLEKDTGNLAQGIRYYEESVRHLEEATTSRDTPAGGPREAYYMLANCYDLLADQAGPNRMRYKELALRYWRQTASFYTVGSPYRDYSDQRINALTAELGQ